MSTRDMPADSASWDMVLSLPFGPFGVRLDGESVAAMAFLPPGTPVSAPATACADDIARRIEQWLFAPGGSLALPLSGCGTPFQRRVWSEISAIPCGSVITYGALAVRLGSAARAVGQACGANPFPLAIPCHRVVAASGIGGFANATDGFLLAAKRWLLANEGVL